MRGLLTVEGRKSMRRIAAGAGISAEQSLQQFISKSPWDWKPVRRSLAAYLQQQVEPLAWVVETLFIPKAGGRSVGVERQFVPHLGRVSNCQQAYGIWMVCQDASYPVDWGLALPHAWTADPGRRSRVGIPEQLEPRSAVQGALADVLEITRAWSARPRPVLMDVGDSDLEQVAGALGDSGVPFVLRVGGSFPVAATNPRQVPFGGSWVSARRLIDSLRGQGRPVEWMDHARQRRRVAPVAAATVHLPSVPGAGAAIGPGLLLLGAWTDPAGARPTEFWLSNATGQPPAQVFRTAQLTRQVHRDQRDVSARVGVSDFEGRSFRGWHHHATLVSIAHAVCLLSQVQESRYARLRPPPGADPAAHPAAHPGPGAHPGPAAYVGAYPGAHPAGHLAAGAHLGAVPGAVRPGAGQLGARRAPGAGLRPASVQSSAS